MIILPYLVHYLLPDSLLVLGGASFVSHDSFAAGFAILFVVIPVIHIPWHSKPPPIQLFLPGKLPTHSAPWCQKSERVGPRLIILNLLKKMPVNRAVNFSLLSCAAKGNYSHRLPEIFFCHSLYILCTDSIRTQRKTPPKFSLVLMMQLMLLYTNSIYCCGPP